MSRNFMDLLRNKWSEGKFVCVGLDSDFDRIPSCLITPRDRTYIDETVRLFNDDMRDATYDLVCAYKLNMAFYLKHGPEGLRALKHTIADIHDLTPDIPVILDGKFSDIGATCQAYASFAFSEMAADAVTVNPYLGAEALGPFLHYSSHGIFVLCRTSNPNAGEFQDLSIADTETGQQEPLYLRVARRVAKSWNGYQNCGLVTGAPYPEEIRRIRQAVPDMPLLIPGFGTQGGSVENIIPVAKDKNGQGFLANSSSQIIFASQEENFAQVAGEKTLELHEQIHKALSQ